jgi:hypothetical protein
MKTTTKKTTPKRKLPRGVTRFTYENSNFNGYRAQVTRKNYHFRKYLSSAKLGSLDKAKATAVRDLKAVRELIDLRNSWRGGKLVRRVRQEIESLGFTVTEPKS